jgi:hypothetical protein
MREVCSNRSIPVISDIQRGTLVPTTSRRMVGSPARRKCEVLSKPHTSRCVDLTRDARPAEGAAVAQSVSKAAGAVPRRMPRPIGAMRQQAAARGYVPGEYRTRPGSCGCAQGYAGFLFLYRVPIPLRSSSRFIIRQKGERIGNSIMTRARWPTWECRASPSSTKPAFRKRLSHRPPVCDGLRRQSRFQITRLPTEARVSETSV